MSLKNLFRNLKIRQKLILVFLPIPLLGILFIGSIWYRNALKAVEKSLKEQTSILAQNASLLIENHLNEREVEIKSASQLGWMEDFFSEFNAKNPISEKSQDRLKRLLVDLSEGYFQITCADSQDNLFAKVQLTSFLPREKLPVHFETRFFNNHDLIGIKEASTLTPDKIFVSEVKSIGGSKTLIFATPIWNSKSDRRLGTIAFALSVSRVAEEIENQNLGIFSQAMILDRSGEVLYHTDRKKINQTMKAAMPYLSKDVSKLTTKMTSTYHNDQNEKWVISYAPVEKTAWSIAIASPIKPFIQSTERAGLIGIALTIGISILLLFLINRLSGKFVADITEVSEGARAVASGDLNRQLPVRTGDEIGGLARDFNKMSADLKRLMRERQANETLVAIGKFSSALAHDLRNPVEGMKLLSSELKKRVNGSDSAFEVADAISQSAENLSTLVNQSLDFARLNKPDFITTDLIQTAEEVLTDFQFGEVKFRKVYLKNLPKVEVDAIQIKRVLANLIQNALDACRRNEQRGECEISLTIKSDDSRIRIEITDTGAGIPIEAREKIFEPFFTTKPAGHGLGLALVRQIISNHGGTITFTSNPGKGTIFVIELPISQRG